MANWIFLIMLIVMLIGVPIAFAITGSTAIGLLLLDIPIVVVAKELFSGVDSFVLIAIPLFILAADLMTKGGMSERIINFSNAITGNLPGGLAIVSIIASLFFASVTGSAVASTAAIGGVMIPIMRDEGYDIKFVAPLLACAGTIGPIIPPSIPLLVYGAAADVSIAKLFVAGIIPGILMAISLGIVTVWISKKRGYKGNVKKYSLLETFKLGRHAILALLTPFIIIGGIISGLFTATESAVVAVVYAGIVGGLIYRELNLKMVWQSIKDSAVLTGQIQIIVAAASLFTWFLTTNQIPQKLTAFVVSAIDTSWFALLLINIIFLITGTFIDTISNVVLFTPILKPIIDSFSIDPIHFGVIMTTNLSIGMVTPPLGVCLFVAASIAKVPFKTILSKDLFVFVLSLILVLLLITYIPSLVLFLPKFF